MATNKIIADRNQKALLDLALIPGNDICADCKARNPRWASHNLGIFLCVHCAGIHRKIGTHITKVKSLTLDSWTKEQVEQMKNNGNRKSNTYFNPNETRHPPPINAIDSERDSELEQYIRSKYEYRRFLDKSAIVASKLGPSRSATGLIPKTALNSTSPYSFPSTTSFPSSSTPPPPKPPAKVSIIRPASAALPTTQAPNLPTSSQVRLPTRSVSQPLGALSSAPSSGIPPQVPRTTLSDPVWNDLVSLQGPSVNTSMPLQYQVHTLCMGGVIGDASQFAGHQATMSPTAFGSSVFGSGMGTGVATNPFSSQGTGIMSTGVPTQMGNPFQNQLTTLSSTNPFGQQQQIAVPTIGGNIVSGFPQQQQQQQNFGQFSTQQQQPNQFFQSTSQHSFPTQTQIPSFLSSPSPFNQQQVSPSPTSPFARQQHSPSPFAQQPSPSPAFSTGMGVSNPFGQVAASSPFAQGQGQQVFGAQTGGGWQTQGQQQGSFGGQWGTM